MLLDQVRNRLITLVDNGAIIQLNGGAPPVEVAATERRLRLIFPEPVARFWMAFDGLEVEDPALTLLPLSELHLHQGMLHFGTCNHKVPLAFAVGARNEAKQWDIVNAETGYRITLTISSFWSAHLWTWIEGRRPIWYDFHAGQG